MPFNNAINKRINRMFRKKLPRVVIIFSITIIATLFNIANASTLQVNGNGTVTDLATGLIWQRLGDDVTRNWNNALTYCSGLSLGGKGDWRLPTVKELSSIVDDRITSPSIDSTAFPDTIGSYFWSSTDFFNDNTQAWLVLFDGVFIREVTKTSPRLVRCVRN